MVDVQHGADSPKPGAVSIAEEPLDEAIVRALVDAAPDGLVMVDEQGRILLVDRKLEEMFGYDRGQMLGEPIEMLLPDSLRPSHRAHRTRFRVEPKARPMGAGLLFGRHSNGSEFPVEISLSPLHSNSGLRVIAAVRDVSDRLAAETYTREIQRVLDSTRDAVLMFDRDTLRFTYVNQGAVDQLGYRRDEMLAMTPLHIKPEMTEAEYRSMIAGVRPGESSTYTTMHRRKDGVDIEVEAILHHPPADRGSPSSWMVSMARDVTDRLEAERRANAAESEIAVLEDRQRIARDLHDTVIQRLFATGLGIEAIRGRVRDPVVEERLQQIVDDLDDTVRQLRSSIFQLNLAPSTRTLRTLIIDTCADERAALGFDPGLRLEGPLDSLDETLAEHLLAVLRESLSNVARHAGATRALVTITVDSHLTLQVEDDGIGVGELAGRPGGNGLRNMEARASKLGGTSDLSAATPRGTRLEWRVPVP